MTRIHFTVTSSNGCPEAPVYATCVIDGEVDRSGQVIMLDVWSSEEAYRNETAGGILASAPFGVDLDSAVKSIVRDLASFPSLFRARRHYIARRIRQAA
jgi:hypothetical protein